MPVNVVFFGDSVCFGQYVSLHKCWVTKVAQKLAATFGDDAVCITNASVNGNTTRQALERMSYDLSGLKPDILTVQFGLNDCNYWVTDKGLPRVTLKCFTANLMEILDRAKAFGVRRRFLVTNHPTTRTGFMAGLPITRSYQQSCEEYNYAIREVAQMAGVDLLDVELSFYASVVDGSMKAFLLDDGLHLNVDGHLAYSKLVYPVMEKAVRELA